MEVLKSIFAFIFIFILTLLASSVLGYYLKINVYINNGDNVSASGFIVIGACFGIIMLTIFRRRFLTLLAAFIPTLILLNFRFYMMVEHASWQTDLYKKYHPGNVEFSAAICIICNSLLIGVFVFFIKKYKHVKK